MDNAKANHRRTKKKIKHSRSWSFNDMYGISQSIPSESQPTIAGYTSIRVTAHYLKTVNEADNANVIRTAFENPLNQNFFILLRMPAEEIRRHRATLDTMYYYHDGLRTSNEAEAKKLRGELVPEKNQLQNLLREEMAAEEAYATHYDRITSKEKSAEQ